MNKVKNKPNNKDKVVFEISPYYYEVVAGKKTYYFIKETGKLDGTSFDIAES